MTSTEKKKEDELQNIRKTSQFAWTGISKKKILLKKICLSMICATPFSHSGYPLGDMRSGPDDTHRRKSLGYFSEGVYSNEYQKCLRVVEQIISMWDLANGKNEMRVDL